MRSNISFRNLHIAMTDQGPSLLIIFDSAKLHSEVDWTIAGEMVLDAPIDFVTDGILYSEIRGMDWFVKTKVKQCGQ